MPVQLPTKKLAKHCNPFLGQPWEEHLVRKADVQRALDEGRLVDSHTSTDHAGRIAWFVANPSQDPIEVDVGCPSFGHHMHWMVTDGNHRLAAAIFAKRAHIPACVSGQLDFAETLFGIDCTEAS